MHKQTTSPKSSQQGVILIEAMIAIVIFAFGVLGIVGLQAAMVRNTTDAKYRSEASYIAQQYVGLFWTDSDDIGNSRFTADKILSELPGGFLNITIDPNDKSKVDVTVSWTQPGETQAHNFTTSSRIQATK